MKYCEPTHPNCNVAAPEAKIPIKDVIITQHLLLCSTLPPLELTQLALLCAASTIASTLPPPNKLGFTIRIENENVRRRKENKGYGVVHLTSSPTQRSVTTTN